MGRCGSRGDPLAAEKPIPYAPNFTKVTNQGYNLRRPYTPAQAYLWFPKMEISSCSAEASLKMFYMAEVGKMRAF